MEAIVDRKQILNKFLNPISKFTDQAIITLNKDWIDCISYQANDKQTILLYTKLLIKTNIPVPENTPDLQSTSMTLNIGSVKKLMNALSCITSDIIALKIEKNYIAYTSPETNFKFHLKEDGAIEKVPTNLEKINSMIFTTEFSITADKVGEIIQASSFAIDSQKIYLSIQNGMIIAELTDKTIPNLDSINISLTNQITGTPFTESIPLRLDIFRLLSSLKFDKLNIKVNNKGVIVFELEDDDFLIKYITSSLIK